MMRSDSVRAQQREGSTMVVSMLGPPDALVNDVACSSDAVLMVSVAYLDLRASPHNKSAAPIAIAT
jgi:hypothetical protein